jgi:hypothetical protein
LHVEPNDVCGIEFQHRAIGRGYQPYTPSDVLVIDDTARQPTERLPTIQPEVNFIQLEIFIKLELNAKMERDRVDANFSTIYGAPYY